MSHPQLTFDAGQRVIHLISDGCTLRTKAEVAAYFAECYARIRAFELPADIIIRYDHLDVAKEALTAFSGGREQMVARLGGKAYRYASTLRVHEDLAKRQVPPDRRFTLYTSYLSAFAQLLADRASKGGPPLSPASKSARRQM